MVLRRYGQPFANSNGWNIFTRFKTFFFSCLPRWFTAHSPCPALGTPPLAVGRLRRPHLWASCPTFRMPSRHHGLSFGDRPCSPCLRRFPMLDPAWRHRAEDCDGHRGRRRVRGRCADSASSRRDCGASCPAGLSALKMRASEAKRRCGSDGLQVRPDGKSSGRRFQLEHQPRFRRDWSINRFGHIVSRRWTRSCD